MNKKEYWWIAINCMHGYISSGTVIGYNEMRKMKRRIENQNLKFMSGYKEE